MQILVDADACPVVKQIENIAAKYLVPAVLISDTSHNLSSDYCTVYTVDKQAESVDVALANLCQAFDVVVTQDYGLAAMCLAKGAYAIHCNGWQYTNRNIARLLESRRGKKPYCFHGWGHMRGPRKRRPRDNSVFEESLEDLVLLSLEEEDRALWENGT